MKADTVKGGDLAQDYSRHQTAEDEVWRKASIAADVGRCPQVDRLTTVLLDN